MVHRLTEQDQGMSDATDATDDDFDLLDAGFADRTPGSLPVSELIGDEVQRVEGTATLREVCSTLADRGVGIVGVGAADEVLAGVVSERDVVKALAAGADPDVTTAADVSVENILYIDPTTTLDEVASEMLSKWTRHLFVGEPQDMMGVVSARDVLGAYASGSMD